MGKKNYVWRVTKGDDGKIDVAFGPKLSEANADTDTKLYVLGRSLVNLGMQLTNSTVNEDDWDEDDDE